MATIWRSRVGSRNSSSPFLQMQRDAGAAPLDRRLGDGELALAVGDPAPALALAGLAAQHLDPVGDHEGGVEADAELADQRHVLRGVAGHLLHEGGGAGARDGAEILDSSSWFMPMPLSAMVRVRALRSVDSVTR